MTQAIQTKYFGPTSRIKAECAGGSIMVGYDPAEDLYSNHRSAAKKLHDKLGWERHSGNFYDWWATGVLKDGTHVHVAKR